MFTQLFVPQAPCVRFFVRKGTQVRSGLCQFSVGICLPPPLHQRRWTCATSLDKAADADCTVLQIALPSAGHTAGLGWCLGSDARAGDVVCLRGDLGAGKTSLARGYVRSARGDNLLDVTSPTYCLDNTYPPPRHTDGGTEKHLAPTIHHMDLWRLESASSRSFVDFEHVFRDHVSLIEWPERLGDLMPEVRLEICIEYVGKEEALAGESFAVPEGPPPADDPAAWGFVGEDDIEGDTQGGESGRVATVIARGGSWPQRLKSMALAPDGSGLQDLVPM